MENEKETMEKMREKFKECSELIKDKLDRTFFRFVVVGIINTVVGMAIMFGLYNLAGASYWVSSAANYVLVSFLSYFLNKYFTFRHQGEAIRSVLRFALNIAVCYFMAYGLAKPWAMVLLRNQDQVVQENVAMLVGMLLFTLLNYLGQRLFVFPDQPTQCGLSPRALAKLAAEYEAYLAEHGDEEEPCTGVDVKHLAMRKERVLKAIERTVEDKEQREEVEELIRQIREGQKEEGWY